jgi:hypothetical protein
VFDPAFAAKLAPCGISFLDAPAGVVRLVLKYLGKDPNAPSRQDLADAEAVLSKIRPYIRNIDSSNDTEALANGDVCAALTYNGTFVQARNRAREAKNGITLSYVIPKEGSLLWFHMLAIPRDAPHVDNAHLFLNYLMTPQVIAHITNFIGNANANSAATPLLECRDGGRSGRLSAARSTAAPVCAGGRSAGADSSHYSRMAEVQDRAIRGGLERRIQSSCSGRALRTATSSAALACISVSMFDTMHLIESSNPLMLSSLPSINPARRPLSRSLAKSATFMFRCRKFASIFAN